MLFLRSYATIPDLIKDVTGIDLVAMLNSTSFINDLDYIPFNSFGFFVACAFITGAFFIYKELQRKEKLGLFTPNKGELIIGRKAKIQDAIPNFLVGFIIGFKVLGMSGCTADPMDYLLSTQGSLIGGIILGVILGGIGYYMVYKKQKDKPEKKIIDLYPRHYIGDMVVVAAVFGILGANVLEIVKDPSYLTQFMQNPVQNLFSGFTIVGGIVFGGLALFAYAKYKKIHVGHFFDSLGPGVMMAYGVGRIGCQVSGDGDWGIAIPEALSKPDWIPQVLWGQKYAHNIINEGVQIAGCAELHCAELATYHFPTPIYETFLASVLFLILWSLRKKFTAIPGMMISLFFVFNGAERFFIEIIRVTDKQYPLFGMLLSMQQVVSMLLVFLGIGIMVGLYVRAKKKG